MGTFFEKNWFKLALGVILIAMIASFAYKLSVNGNGNSDERLTAMKAAPAFQLQDLDGKTVTSESMDGKVRLVYFFYSYCPDVCLPTSFLLSQVQDELKKKDLLGAKAEIISITVDPVRDTAQVLKDFGNRFESKPIPGGWTFLRGEEAKIHKLAEDFGIMVIKEKDGNFSHSNAILLVDKKGQLRNYYDASRPELDAAHIVKDVVTLSKEK
ncbi:SCO family protein [Paenibacillus roseipurpureus]|uniref:SCO family protein n=1 Tax=Paenibacillus roseopurpureus TaxID=2918901 RepID=A0AA96LTC7_9BACL|nr:SCO family protein [Paenibacillus sp. MBLB1832]WNR45613.1 SCO family protein [Paenibacillus sp. MBLB1832]